MALIGYGFPKIYNANGGEGDWLYVAQDSQFMVAVSSTCVQLWCNGLQKILLSVVSRQEQDIAAEGVNVGAFWSPAKCTLAVVTSENSLHLYSVHVFKDPLPGYFSMAKELPRADIYLRSSSKIDVPSKATSITGDRSLILIGFSDCSLATMSWTGKMRETAAPLADPLFQYDSFPTCGIADMHYCERSHMLVATLDDGSCAMCTAPSGLGLSNAGLSPLSEVVFSHWVCDASLGATCARIGACSQMVAVGCASGEIALFRMTRSLHSGMSGGLDASGSLQTPDSPIRILTLEPWGHRTSQTGAVSQLAWTPDCRAIAVGFRLQGVVVWSPSGCRLLCSLRQPWGASAFRCDAERSSTASMDGIAETSTADGGSSSTVRPLEAGVVALSWGHLGYHLVVAEAGGCAQLVEMTMAHSLPSHHRVAHSGWGAGLGGQVAEELHVMQAHDRLLVVGESVNAQPLPPMGAASAVDTGGPGNDLSVSHVMVPLQYISANWPVTHVAISGSGLDIAVAGRRGLALYSRASDRWRLFGDVSQERQVSCRALCWLHSMVVVCSGPEDGQTHGSSGNLASAANHSSGAGGMEEGSGKYELILFPRYHLDMSSVICRHPLTQPPISMDCIGRHILLASDPLEIQLYEVELSGKLTPSGSPKASLVLVREISMLDVGRPLVDLALVPAVYMVNVKEAHKGSTAKPDGGELPAATVPRQCVLLRWGGLMSVLDLERGSEIALSTDVECFWLSDSLPCRLAKPEPPPVTRSLTTADPLPSIVLSPHPMAADAAALATASEPTPKAVANGHGLQHPDHPHLTPLDVSAAQVGRTGVTSAAAASCSGAGHLMHMDVEMPWWAYGPRGMQLWFPSSLNSPLSPKLSGSQHHDIELEFDQEVYPMGISLADAAIVGVTQRLVRGLGGGNFTGAAPYNPSGVHLPCFHPIPESQPVLPCLLRRLLQQGKFQEAVSLAKHHDRGPHFTRSLEWLIYSTLEMEAGKSHTPSLLASAASLGRHFPQFADVVVSVARKTDAALWPSLFKAIGSPSALLEGLLVAGALGSAACFLLVIDRLEGAEIAHTQALRLIRSSLDQGEHALVGELLRFMLPPHEVENCAASLAADGLGPGVPSPPGMVGQSTPSFANGLEQSPQPVSSSGLARQKSGGVNRTWVGWLLGVPSAGVGPSSRESSSSSASPSDAGTHGKEKLPSSVFATGLDGGSFSLTSSNLEGGATCSDAHALVAHHAWSLLESGQLTSLAELQLALSFLSGGLARLMMTHRDGTYAMSGLNKTDAADVLSAVAIAVQELPVWSSSNIEGEASRVMQLCKEVGAGTWVVALAVILVDIPEITSFIAKAPKVWPEFVANLKSDETFSFLYEIVDLLSGEQRRSGEDHLLCEQPLSRDHLLSGEQERSGEQPLPVQPVEGQTAAAT